MSESLKPEEVLGAFQNCISFQLASKSMTKEDSETWHQALGRAFCEVPQVKLIEQAQYLKEIILPKAEKSGLNSDQYKFYYGVFESIMYSIKILDRDYSLRMRLSNEMLMNEFLNKRVQFLQNELTRYTTMDELTAKELATDLLTTKKTDR